MTLATVSAVTIIVDALQKIGVYAPNETLSSADANLGLTQLNDLVDDWLSDSIFLYQVTNISAAIVRSMQDYTVGPGGMVPVPRPIRVVVGRGVAALTVAGKTTSVDSVSALEWNAIYTKANNATIPFLATPAAMYYEPQNPLGLLSVSPLPATAGTLVFPAFYGMPNFASLTTKYALAPGQEQALKANLAIALNPYFGGSVVSPELLATAQQNKTNISLTNRLSRAMSKRNREPPARGTTPKQ